MCFDEASGTAQKPRQECKPVRVIRLVSMSFTHQKRHLRLLAMYSDATLLAVFLAEKHVEAAVSSGQKTPKACIVINISGMVLTHARQQHVLAPSSASL